MADQTVEAAPSAAEDVFGGETPTLDEYNLYRSTGEVPARFKPADNADPASAEPPEEAESEGEQPESDPEAEPAEQQEKPAQPQKLGAKGRIAKLEATIEDLWSHDDPDVVKIAQLTATIDKIERGAGLKRKTEAAPVPGEPKPQAQPQQNPQTLQTFEDWHKAFDADAWFAEYAKHNPDASYEKANAAMFAHISNVQMQFAERKRAAETQARELQTKVDEARERYENFDEVMQPALAQIVGDARVSPVVKAMLNDSDVLPDLLFTLGSDEKELNHFLRMAESSPGKAIRYIAVSESLIREELEKGEQPEPRKAPAKPQSSAPKPPSPVSGGSTRAFDVSDESLSPDEWMLKRNQDVQRRGKA